MDWDYIDWEKAGLIFGAVMIGGWALFAYVEYVISSRESSQAIGFQVGFAVLILAIAGYLVYKDANQPKGQTRKGGW